MVRSELLATKGGPSSHKHGRPVHENGNKLMRNLGKRGIAYADNKDTEQHAHSHSLNGAFVAHFQNYWIL